MVLDWDRDIGYIFRAGGGRERRGLVVCGVDLYIYPGTATAAEGISPAQPCPYDSSHFFSDRHYRIIHLDDLDDYDPRSDIGEVAEDLLELKPSSIGLLTKPLCEQNDTDSTYVLTPLTKSEEEELMGLLGRAI